MTDRFTKCSNEFRDQILIKGYEVLWLPIWMSELLGTILIVMVLWFEAH